MKSLYYSTGIGCALAVAYVAWAILNWVWITPKKIEKCLRKQGFKGNSYRILFGDSKEILRKIKQADLSPPIALSDDMVPRVMPMFADAVKSHGNNCFVWVGPRPSVNIMDPELIKEIFNKHTIFQKPKVNPFLRLLASGLVDYEGEKWAKHRKIMNPAFHMEKLKVTMSSIHLSCNEMLSKFDEMVSKEGSELDLWEHIQELTNDGLCRAAFSSNLEQGKRIFELQSEQSRLVVETMYSPYIPGWRFVPTKRNMRLKEISYEIKTSLRDMVNKRMEVIQSGGASKNDFLGMLLDSNLYEIKRKGNNEKFGMSIDEVSEECEVFYLAAQATTPIFLVWTMIMLSSFPDWQQRARDEVFEVFGNDLPNVDNLHRLKIVNMILHEVLRLYPPVPRMTRTVYEDTKFGEITFSPGTTLTIPVILLNHDPRIWGDDVKEFKPERFADGVSKATKTQGAYIPFSMGPRVCIGQNFAMIQAKMVIAMFLQRFSFQLSPSYAHAPLTVLSVIPQYGAHLIVRKL